MIGGTVKAPPSLAALSEARQLLAMLDDGRSLRKQLEKLAAGAAKAIAAAKTAKAESDRALNEVGGAKAALEKEKTVQNARAEALRGRERELKAREDELKPKWEALRKEAFALQGRASRMAAAATAVARDLES